jgi:hypothetical protein
MMVEGRVSNDEVEDSSIYNTIHPNDDGDTPQIMMMGVTADMKEILLTGRKNLRYIGGRKSCMITKVLKN